MALSPFSMFVVGKHYLGEGECYISHATFDVTHTDDGGMVFEVEDCEGTRAIYVVDAALASHDFGWQRIIFHGNDPARVISVMPTNGTGGY